ncbi:DUF397 domain-containing protein [Streptomyces sp. NPDC002845]
MPPALWQKSSYCGEGEACVHIARTWQKSSHCGAGHSCVHVTSKDNPLAIHLTESSDPTQAILNTTPRTFDALLQTLKTPKKDSHV